MHKTYLYGFLLACFLSAAAPAFAQQDNYYQKVPKLIPQADGSYRVANGEFYLVPVSKDGTAKPVQATTSLTETNTIEQTPATIVVEKNKNLPGKLPYISVGVSGIRSKVRAAGEDLLKDTKPAGKLAFGGRLSPYLRVEAFYQYRDEIEEDGSRLVNLGWPLGKTNVPYEVRAKMQDIGANLFVYVNPKDSARVFLGAGIAATRVQPTLKLFGQDVTDKVIFSSKWCATPSVFLGVEMPISKRVDIDLTAFYSHTNIHTDDIKNIKSYGLALNVRFNLPEQTITYIK